MRWSKKLVGCLKSLVECWFGQKSLQISDLFDLARCDRFSHKAVACVAIWVGAVAGGTDAMVKGVGWVSEGSG